ncbi:MAG: RNA 2',3'-cyclic phosphodiesterase [Desulfurobacterium sp.]|nr:MAG: RNA 2',3'-cyclic phosphodiesterase [Desulfurobacterium sp.]
MPKKRLFVGTLTSVVGLEEVREFIDSLGIVGKWVEKENLHFTYRFLGDVEEEKIKGIAGMLRGRLKGVRAPTVEYRGLGVFPSLRSPRVLWVGVESETIYEVKRRVDMALLPFGFPPEEGFTPHLTLLRIKKMRHQTRFKNYIFKMREHLFERKVEAKVCLIESKLTPRGPVYSVLEEILLD